MCKTSVLGVTDLCALHLCAEVAMVVYLVTFSDKVLVWHAGVNTIFKQLLLLNHLAKFVETSQGFSFHETILKLLKELSMSTERLKRKLLLCMCCVCWQRVRGPWWRGRELWEGRQLMTSQNPTSSSQVNSLCLYYCLPFFQGSIADYIF